MKPGALDIVPDYGERVGADGEPIDEFATVLALIPTEIGVDGVMLAGAIARQRCDGRGNIAGALEHWTPEGEPN